MSRGVSARLGQLATASAPSPPFNTYQAGWPPAWSVQAQRQHPRRERVRSRLGVGAGTSASVFAERGFGKAGTVGSGTTEAITVHIKAGFGKAGTVASKVRERAKTGYATGHPQRRLQARRPYREGYGVVNLAGSGERNVIYGETGYGAVGADGYGEAFVSVYLTILDPIYTGRIAGTLVGAINGYENRTSLTRWAVCTTSPSPPSRGRWPSQSEE